MREQDKRGIGVRRMIKRREPMEDGRRYMLYYTFEREVEESAGNDTNETRSDSADQNVEQQNV